MARPTKRADASCLSIKNTPLPNWPPPREYYQEKKGGMMTLEYILIAGVNDGLDQIKPLAALARRLGAKVNLIPYNTVEGLPWARPEEAVQEKFLAALEREKVTATLRREKGHDIDAACGQLRLKTERELTTAIVTTTKNTENTEKERLV